MSDDISTTSVELAAKYGKAHGDVLLDIEAIISSRSYLGSLCWFTDCVHYDGTEYIRGYAATPHGQMLLGYNRRKS